jgi:hypothetical protein
MPQKFKKYNDPKLDGRYKITPDQYPRVRFLYGQLGSTRKVGAMFGVSKNIIAFIVNPERKENDRQRKIENKVWLRYYDRQEHNAAIQQYREKKKKLGLVIIKGRDKINKSNKLCVCCHKNPVEHG